MDRAAALLLVEQHVENENLVRHMLATEAIMRALALRLDEDASQWGLAGLLHDLDVERTADLMEVHGRQTVAMLREAGLRRRGRAAGHPGAQSGQRFGDHVAVRPGACSPPIR